MLSPLISTPLRPDAGEARSVSVVVPSYNHAKFVERTLRSIYRQTLAPFELIVIDDGSHDESVAVIERVLQDAPFPARLIARENRGLSATLNEAFAQTVDSRFFAYIGSDDVWLPEFLERRVKLLEERPEAVLAYGNAYSIDADDRIIDSTVDWARYVDGDVREMLLDTLAPLSPTVVYRRSAITDLRWNENSRLEDYELYLRLSVRGEFAYDPSILSAWRQHGANASEGTQMMLDERLAAVTATADVLKLSPAELAMRKRLVYFRSAQEFMRSGRKRDAIVNGIPNLSGAKSVNEVIRFLGGLATPSERLARRRLTVRAKAAEQYGRLEL
ncbi:MAG TPA: glycosyltransferase [Pyrinomonadaceae bacterium]|nr:glycosyltransferase [Pyrinomonadaceae bacterium]